MSKVNITITDDMVDRANRTYMARCDRSLSHATTKAILDAAINGEPPPPPEPQEPEIPVTDEMMAAARIESPGWAVHFPSGLAALYRAMRKLEPQPPKLLYIGGPHAANEASLTDDVVDNLIGGESIYADALPIMVNRLIKTLDVWRAAARLAQKQPKLVPQILFEGFDAGKMMYSVRMVADSPDPHEAR